MKNTITIKTNEMIEAGAYDQSVSYLIKEILESNILHDYENGIKQAEIQIFPSDFYNEFGVKKKNWANGEIIKINEIVRIMNKEGTDFLKDSNGNDIYFRAVDRKVEYNGQVIMTLILQEIRQY